MKWLVETIRARTKTPTPSASSISQKLEIQTPSPVSARAGQFDDANVHRNRFTIENVLDRYGGLLNMRRYLFAYSFILFASHLFINFWKTSLEMVRYDNASYSESRGSPLCCCKPTERLQLLSKGLHEMYLDKKQVDTWYNVAFLVSAIMCSVLERFGRRRMVLISLPLSTISLFFLALIHDETLIVAMIFLNAMSYAVTYLTFTSNIMEMLPRSMRMIGISFIQMGRTHPTMLTSFYALFPSDSLMIMILLIASINIIACGLAFKYCTDSLCHMVVNDRIDEADKRVMEEEKILLKEKNPNIDLNNLDEADSRFLKKTVQMITDDLAFDEDDSYSIGEFLKRMIRNKPFYRIVYGLGAIIFAGVIDGLSQVYLREMDLAGVAIIGHKTVAKVGSVAGLLVIRKWSRLRASKLIMSLIVLNLAARGSMVQYDSNHCTSIVIRHELQSGSGVLTLMLYLLNDINIYTILLNVVEQSPSTLRIPISSFYVIVMAATKEATKSSFRTLRDVYRVTICSTGLCILIGIGIFFHKVLDEDSFSVFMNDLVKERNTGKSAEILQRSDESLKDNARSFKNSPIETKRS
uniref:Membrane transporter n=1 Tax=Pristionchus pacificus TaxID=54126 RepID=A0A8R1YW95_PRIPA